MNPSSSVDVGSPGAVIHLGAGACSELDFYLSLRPGSIVLVEANPFAVRDLQRRCALQPEVKVIPTAINSVPGPATLRIYNISQYSTLSVATGLHRSFPGLRLRKEIKVKAITIDDLIGQLSLDTNKSHWLIIDTPGKEADIVTGLIRSGQLSLFTKIVLHSSVDALYEGQGGMGSLVSSLSREGYEIIEIDKKFDADFAVCTLRRNPVLIENRLLHERVDALQGQLNMELKKAQADITRLEQDYVQVQAGTAVQAEHAHHHREKIEQLKAVLASAKSKVCEETGEKTATVADAHQRIAELERELQQMALRLNQQLEACKQGIREMENQLRASFGKELSNAVRQIEAFVKGLC